MRQVQFPDTYWKVSSNYQIRWRCVKPMLLQLLTTHYYAPITDIYRLWFTPDSNKIWGFSQSKSLIGGWEIIEDNKSGTRKLQPLEKSLCPLGMTPWQSPNNYRLTDDGWILSPNQKRLLWLPHNWRAQTNEMAWSGQFLGLLHLDLPDIVILEMLDWHMDNTSFFHPCYIYQPFVFYSCYFSFSLLSVPMYSPWSPLLNYINRMYIDKLDKKVLWFFVSRWIDLLRC